MKKKVIIAGPIGDFGGRDVEVNIIAKALESEYAVKILSTSYMTQNSFALRNLKSTSWTTIPKLLSEENLIVNLLSRISKFLNKSDKNASGFVINSLSKKALDLDRLFLEILYNEILKTDVVILCVQLTTKFFPEILDFCHEKNIPCFVRTTGTIRKIDVPNFEFLKKGTLFFHHSETNAENLNKQLKLPYVIIDQCALNEKELLSISNSVEKPIRYGYLGRLSEEKGALPLTNYFSSLNYPFIIAGDGPQKSEILNVIKKNPLCQYIGLIDINEIVSFFEKIDVLIIPSFEESGPLVGLEAMAAGKIIISTKVGAMNDRLSDMKSFWFDIENVSTLQECIDEIESLNLEALTAISTANRIRYKEEYSFKAITKKYQNNIVCE